MFTDEAFLDLRGLVREIRKASHERSRIPAHSGKSTPEVRKANRRRRRELADRIYELERGIIAWALVNIPSEGGEHEQ